MSFIIFLSKDLFHGIDKIPLSPPMKQTPKTEACKPAICSLLFLKLGMTLLSWSPPCLRACFSDEKEYQNGLRNTHAVQNKRNESNAHSEVLKKTPNLWGSLWLRVCNSALWTCLSAIHGMRSNYTQFQDVAVLMQEENKQREAHRAASRLWLGTL